ncbi:MAG: sigma-70 family RNA polymerase sigma factor [Bacteroidetes bacterium]|nr:sigma-70 family RNA polymerase sigma factor [Bacteroidota bacterium]
MENPQDPNLTIHSWVKLYADGLYGWAYYRVSNKEVAQDLVQDTFLSALKSQKNFRGDSSEKTWLHTILKNKIIDYYRSKAKHQTRELNQQVVDRDYYFDEHGQWKADAMPKDWGIDYSQPLESEEFMMVLEKCKEKLTAAQNTAFTMKYIEDMPTEEVCKELEIAPSNYWVIVHRAKLQLRKCLEINWIKK